MNRPEGSTAMSRTQAEGESSRAETWSRRNIRLAVRQLLPASLGGSTSEDRTLAGSGRRALGRVLYSPPVNTGLRAALRPLARFVPQYVRFPIVEPFELTVDEDIRLRIVANETSYVSKVLFWQGVEGYEYHMVPIFLALAREARVVVDVGANLGYYSLLAAAANPGGRVFAFEPSPAAFAYLIRNIEANGFVNIQPEQAALSDEAGTLTFIEARNPKFEHVEAHLTGASGIEDPGEGYVYRHSIEVPAQTLDSYMAKVRPGTLDLLKIDAEASEHLVLRGGEHTIASDRPIIFCEALPNRVEAEMQEIFDATGYTLYNARPEGLRPVAQLAGPNRISHDFIAVPAERRESFESRFV